MALDAANWAWMGKTALSTSWPGWMHNLYLLDPAQSRRRRKVHCS
jgi:hypothetical protein